MILLMIFCYLMCWTPYAVVSVLVAFGRQNVISPTVAIIPSIFAKSSTAYNAIIYGFMSRKVIPDFTYVSCVKKHGMVIYLMQFSFTVSYYPLACVYILYQFRHCVLQLVCSRLAHRQCSIRNNPLTCTSQTVRPIVMSHSRNNRPKKRVTFNSSSIVFIIANNDTDPLDMSYKCKESSKSNVIQVRPL